MKHDYLRSSDLAVLLSLTVLELDSRARSLCVNDEAIQPGCTLEFVSMPLTVSHTLLLRAAQQQCSQPQLDKTATILDVVCHWEDHDKRAQAQHRRRQGAQPRR
ncbi:hypothetical protein C8Q80DRAFT_1137683 [Daedaleopsis nitida]|nr:hypothetical protein C8Q80DRAFT_1137683 [Daedaleopsis nitida]